MTFPRLRLRLLLSRVCRFLHCGLRQTPSPLPRPKSLHWWRERTFSGQPLRPCGPSPTRTCQLSSFTCNLDSPQTPSLIIGRRFLIILHIASPACHYLCQAEAVFMMFDLPARQKFPCSSTSIGHRLSVVIGLGYSVPVVLPTLRFPALQT